RIVLVLAVPITLMLALHSDALVHVLFGEGYGASARALRVLAPVIPLSYVCIVSSSHLVQLGKVWVITRVAILGIVVHPLISLVTIPYGVAHGSGAFGAGVSTLVSEVVVTVGFLVALGRSGPNRPLVGNLLRLVITCAVGTAVHFVLPPLAALDSPVSLWRLAAEVPVFIGVGILLGAIPMREMVMHVRQAVRK
ncbi:MAG: polysaccharide biosynthesis C-terminal domain-containing protein, partial [Clostridia bacterium]|nr:polysaccharide biosynthesis C-terminal domain-containing protein [Deltaproteobacteria bacterium]